MTDDMGCDLELPDVGELTFPQWRDWLVRYNKFIGERDVRYAAGLRERDERIEKLETALKHCINALQQYEMGDDRPRGPIPNDDLRPWLLGAMDNAIKVLEGKDD